MTGYNLKDCGIELGFISYRLLEVAIKKYLMHQIFSNTYKRIKRKHRRISHLFFLFIFFQELFHRCQPRRSSRASVSGRSICIPLQKSSNSSSLNPTKSSRTKCRCKVYQIGHSRNINLEGKKPKCL